MNSDDVFFVGPLPPPVHGFSQITVEMLNRLRDSVSVSVFDSTPAPSFLLFIKRWLAFVFSMARARQGVLYLAMSGGFRQFVDLSFLGVARFLGFRVFLHHHSFRYLNSPSFLAKFVFFISSNAVHIVLCECMADRLSAIYLIPRFRIRVVSNSAFMTESAQVARSGIRKESLVVGFLSNITIAKGCFEFIDTVRNAKRMGFSVDGIMAGPIDPDIFEEFQSKLAGVSNIQHVGAVYEERKSAFFSSIDILIFPTRYVNEAEPLVIWEALRAGVPVISLSRGCIDSIVDLDFGWVFGESEDFSSECISVFESLRRNASLLDEMKISAKLHFDKSMLDQQLYLRNLIFEIVGYCHDSRSF